MVDTVRKNRCISSNLLRRARAVAETNFWNHCSRAKQVKEWNATRNFWYRQVPTLAVEKRELLDDWEFVLCDMSRLDAVAFLPRMERCFDRSHHFYCKRLNQQLRAETLQGVVTQQRGEKRSHGRFHVAFIGALFWKLCATAQRKALRRGKPNCVESVQEPNKELAGLCILEHKIFSFGNMILRDRRSTSYDLASLFRGRRSTLDRRSGKIAKPIGTRPSALHSTFHFWRKSRRIVSFLTLSNSSFVFKLADRQIDRSIDRSITTTDKYHYATLWLQLQVQIYYATLHNTNYTTLH